MRVIVFGLGGVGSHLAYMLTKANAEFKHKENSSSIKLPLITEIDLVDFDIVEHKNLGRQLFFMNQIGTSKTIAVEENIEGRSDPVCKIETYNMKATDEIDLAVFDRNDFAFVCTDELKSKIKIADYFKNKLIVNCDEDYYEVKSILDDSERFCWQIGEGGYSSPQNFNANLMGAFHAYRLFMRRYLDMDGHEPVKDWIVKQKVDEILEILPKTVQKITEKKPTQNATQNNRPTPLQINAPMPLQPMLEEVSTNALEANTRDLGGWDEDD